MKKSRILYYTAAILGLMIVVAHETIGSTQMIEPISNMEVSTDTKWLYHWTWHIDIIGVLALITMLFIGARIKPGKWLITMSLLIATGYGLVGILLALFGNPVMWQTPAPYAWTFLPLLIGIGLYLDKRSY
ncbi:MAG: hypothetical protein AAFN93_07950 [Bacteroidota bacterium]